MNPPFPRGWLRVRRVLAWGGALYVALAVTIGLFSGIGFFTFGYGQGASYMSNNPQACINCHVMQGHYNSWMNSSHRHVAVCNDCHLPHHSLMKWVTKSDNGFFHSLAFTTGQFHEPIQIKPRNRRVTQSTCVDCHAIVVHQMLPKTSESEMLQCISCHYDVGHAHK